MHWRFLGSWQWLLALFSVASLVETVFWGQMNAFTPLYLPRLGVAPGDVAVWTGTTVAISNAIGIPFLPFWGALADRYARQPVLVRAFVAHLLAGVVTLLAGSVWVFVLGRAISSFSLGIGGLMMTTLAERTPGKRVGLAFSILNGAGPVGAFLGPLAGGPIVDAYGFRALVVVDLALLLGVALALTFGYQDDFQGTDRGSLLRMAAGSVGIIWRSPRLRALFPALFLAFAGWMLAITYVPLAVQALYTGGDPGTAVGGVLGVGGLVTLFLGPALGALGDRVGHWRVLLLGACVEVALWPLPALAQGLVAFAVAWAALNGVASGVFAISFTVLARSAESETRGRVMSFAYLPVNLGFMVGPALGGVVASGNVFMVFPLAAVLTAMGIGALVVARRQPVARAAVAERVA
jgi:DHA1 family multidrug resistance protein-like MFS transporter